MRTRDWDSDYEMELSEPDFYNLLEDYRSRFGRAMLVPLNIRGVDIYQSESVLSIGKVKVFDRSLEGFDVGQRLTYGSEMFGIKKFYLCGNCSKPVNQDGSLMEAKDKAYIEKYIKDYGKGKATKVDGECCEYYRMVRTRISSAIR